MGLIRDIFGMGRAVKDVAEVFTVNKTRAAEFQHLEHAASLDQFGREFTAERRGGFDGFVDGLNRLPRPVLALGTMGLFVFAMADPAAFSTRMSGLDTIPTELWWLLGAIVSFYFGARELHYTRKEKPRRAAPGPAAPAAPAAPGAAPVEPNAAITAWMDARG